MADILEFKARKKSNPDEELIPLYRDYEMLLLQKSELLKQIIQKEQQLLGREEAAKRRLMRNARKLDW